MAASNAAGLHYPLTKMNFLVSVEQVDEVAAFSEVTGIDASVNVIEFRQGNSHSLSPIKLQGLVKHGNITLKLGYVRGQDFKTWIVDCVSERRKKTPRRKVTIELVDIGPGAPQELVKSTSNNGVLWVLSNAWVTKYNGPNLNASANEVAIESVELAYEELTIPN